MRRLRFDELDGLRGIAAFSVVVHHCLLSIPDDQYTYISSMIIYTPFKLLVYGRPLVILFFALSGFVLTSAITNVSPLNLTGYWAKRVVRIYVPYFASIVLSLALYAALHPLPQLSLPRFPQETWAFGVTFEVLLGHTLLLGDRPGSSFNTVDWSLVYELRISLLMPVVVWLLCQIRPLTGLATVIALAAATELTLWVIGYTSTPYVAYLPAESLLYTLHFLPIFASGGVLYLNLNWVNDRLRGFSRITLGIMVLVTVGCLMNKRDLVQGVGSLLLLTLSFSVPKLSKVLVGAVPQFLGRISYSLYLVHVPVIEALIYALDTIMSRPQILMLGTLLSVALAMLGERFVERPTIQLGRLLDSMIRAWHWSRSA